jgi:hypothetical protein
LLAGEHDPAWLGRHYEDHQRARIRQHIRFADFWYASNGQLTDLHDECQRIAADSGLAFTGADAWEWLAQGGFANDFLGQVAVGGYDLASTKQLTQRFHGEPATWRVNEVNVLRLRLHDAQRLEVPYYRDGKVVPIPAFERDGRRLLIVGVVGVVAQLIEQIPDTPRLFEAAEQRLRPHYGPAARYQVAQALELLLSEGWAHGTADPTRPFVRLTTPDDGVGVHAHREPA